MFGQSVIPYVLCCAAAACSVILRKLTVAGGIMGAIVAILIYGGGGYMGIAMLGTFFFLGVVATSMGCRKKEAAGMAEERKGQRTAGQVWANGGIAALAGTIAICYPSYKESMLLAMAGSLASATADTLSSELGMVYGSRHYHILTWKKDRCGENGVVSLEGTCAGILGSMAIALVYAFGNGWNISLIYIVVAGTIGNLVDSILGATLERRGLIVNNTVNAFNTLTGAIVVVCLNMLA